MSNTRGTKPKPKSLRLLHGDRADRINENEPEPELLDHLPIPTMPLNTHGKVVWDSLAPRMLALGLLTTVDIQTFSLYCYELGMYKECREGILAEGMVIYVGENNYPTPNPLISIGNKHYKNAYDMAAQFGLTPSSRTRISVGAEKPKSKISDLKKHG
jgi:P27 family predicted phage terminase small subunit